MPHPGSSLGSALLHPDPAMSDAVSLPRDRFPRRSLRRAERAARCSPFRLDLFRQLERTSVGVPELTGAIARNHGLTRRVLTELQADDEVTWLIEVGLLRREVDGQGLTDRVRLTPLGLDVLHAWELKGSQWKPAGLREHFYNAWSRWVRLPF